MAFVIYALHKHRKNYTIPNCCEHPISTHRRERTPSSSWASLFNKDAQQQHLRPAHPRLRSFSPRCVQSAGAVQSHRAAHYLARRESAYSAPVLCVAGDSVGGVIIWQGAAERRAFPRYPQQRVDSFCFHHFRGEPADFLGCLNLLARFGKTPVWK